LRQKVTDPAAFLTILNVEEHLCLHYFHKINRNHLNKDKSSSSSQNSSYCKTSSKNEELQKKSIPEAKDVSKRASSSSRSKEGQY